MLVKENYRTNYFPEKAPPVGYGNYKKPAYKSASEPAKNDLSLPLSQKVAVPRESRLLCLLVLCFILISLGIITLYGRVIAGNYQIENMRRELLLLQEENESLQIEVKRLSSLERIENIALEELGLQYPENRQWLILSAKD